MVDVRFELTTNDPCSADDATCEGLWSGHFVSLDMFAY